MAITTLKDLTNQATEIVSKLNISKSTLYEYVNRDGAPKKKGEKILKPDSNKKITEKDQ